MGMRMRTMMCVGEPRGATCGVLLFTCVSRRDLAPSPSCNSPPHVMAEEEPATARPQSLVQDQMERELTPLCDQIASLADLLKQKQETGGGESMRGLYLVSGVCRPGGRRGRGCSLARGAAQRVPGAAARSSVPSCRYRRRHAERRVAGRGALGGPQRGRRPEGN